MSVEAVPVETRPPIVIEIPIKFKDQEEPSILRDAAVIKKSPFIVTALKVKHPDWETKGVKLEDPLSVEFDRAAGDFCFTYANRYVPPDIDNGDPKPEDYAEANEKTLDELKEIIEAANFLGCSSLMDCIGFVIAKKLEEEETVEDVARHLGVDYIPVNGDDGWIVPPKEQVFQKKKQ